MVKWRDHQLEEVRREKRKAQHCVVCNQTWTGRIGVACPGIPVLHTQSVQYASKTQLAKERLYPPDEDQPDACYRKLKSPYYGWLFDRTKAIARPLTIGQIEGKQKREETIRKRYGCRFCQERYLKRHYDEFVDGTCSKCRNRIRTYNELVLYCQELKQEDAFLISLETEEPRAILRWGALPTVTITRVEVWPLSVEQPITNDPLNLKEVEMMLRFYLDTGQTTLLAATPLDRDILYHWLFPDLPMWEHPDHDAFRSLLISSLFAYPLERDWRPCAESYDGHQTEKRADYFHALQEMFQVGGAEELRETELIRNIILHMAGKELISFP